MSEEAFADAIKERFRQEAAEAVKKARREGEEQGRQEVEAEISKLKAEAEAKVEELSALLDTWKERVKTQDAKMDAEVASLNKRKLGALTDLAVVKQEYDKAVAVQQSASSTSAERIASTRALLAESQQRKTGLQKEIAQLSAVIDTKLSLEVRQRQLEAQLAAQEAELQQILDGTHLSSDGTTAGDSSGSVLGVTQARMVLEQVFASLKASFGACSAPTITPDVVVSLVKTSLKDTLPKIVSPTVTLPQSQPQVQVQPQPVLKSTVTSLSPIQSSSVTVRPPQPQSQPQLRPTLVSVQPVRPMTPTPTPAPVPVPVPTAKTCGKCGTTITIERFCSQCGEKQF